MPRQPIGCDTEPDWQRIFPDADHSWVMGLRRSDAVAFLAPRDASGAVLAERSRWLGENPERYVALTPAAGPALKDTVSLARSLGATIDPSLAPWDQMLALGRVWESDFVWMHAEGGEPHRLTGGVVCFPSSWDLGEKLGRTMSEVHRPVPALNPALDRRIETFLAKMDPGVAWDRENVGLSRIPDLNQHPARLRRPLDLTVSADEVRVRLEHQLLLKLPLSGSILFAIRVEVVPLRRVLGCRAAAVRLARWLETMTVSAAEYKGVLDARDVILSMLRPGGSAEE